MTLKTARILPTEEVLKYTDLFQDIINKNPGTNAQIGSALLLTFISMMDDLSPETIATIMSWTFLEVVRDIFTAADCMLQNPEEDLADTKKN